MRSTAWPEPLAQTLNQAMWETEFAVGGELVSDLLTRIHTVQPSVVAIVSIAPGGTSHTRYICKRIKSQFPSIKIIVGRWAGPADDGAFAATRLRNAGADDAASTLDETRNQLLAWRTVAADTAAEHIRNGSPNRENEDPTIGTATASS